MEIKNVSEPVFGRWYIDEELGSGSFGTVYRIKRENFGKMYYSALKVIQIPQNDSEIQAIRNELSDDQSVMDYYTGFVQDFAKEIELMSELKGNTNIVSFEDHDFIRNPDGIGWTILIRMELLAPLNDFITESDITVNDVIKLGIDICTALELCEERHIIHRDIKPGNIFISAEGNYKLGDFGIARELEKTTGGLSKKGTYTYMAPEVYLGKPYNDSVDIYSLGLVMYQLLNRNRAPFLPDYPTPLTHTDKENAFARRMRGERLPDITRIPKPLNDVVKKACAYEPFERYRSASEFKAALNSILRSNAPVEAVPFSYNDSYQPPSNIDPMAPVTVIPSNNPSTAPSYQPLIQPVPSAETMAKKPLDLKKVIIPIAAVVVIAIIALVFVLTRPEPIDLKITTTSASGEFVTEEPTETMKVSKDRYEYNAKELNNIFINNPTAAKLRFPNGDELARADFYSDYTEIEFFESNGSQYINTGFKTTPNTTFETKFMTKESLNDTNLFGSRVDKGNQDLSVWVNTSENKGIAMHVMSQGEIDTHWIYKEQLKGVPITLKYEIHDVDSTTKIDRIFINGKKYYDQECNKVTFEPQFRAYLFGYNHSGTPRGMGKFKLYYFKLYDNKELVRDFIPVLDSDENACLFEKVEGRFYYPE